MHETFDGSFALYSLHVNNKQQAAVYTRKLILSHVESEPVQSGS